jgi:hypothetical protein
MLENDTVMNLNRGGSKREEETGVDDARHVRAKIAALYNGDFQKHMEETNRIVEPLIDKLGLKRGSTDKPAPPQFGSGS